ncbi:MAG: hypothetical protein ACRC2O_06860, partial [Chitinophagaceae bacterium]
LVWRMAGSTFLIEQLFSILCVYPHGNNQKQDRKNGIQEGFQDGSMMTHNRTELKEKRSFPGWLQK